MEISTEKLVEIIDEARKTAKHNLELIHCAECNKLIGAKCGNSVTSEGGYCCGVQLCTVCNSKDEVIKKYQKKQSATWQPNMGASTITFEAAKKRK